MECAVCNGPLHLPATLPCGHTFCQQCIAAALRFRSKELCVVCKAEYRKVPRVNMVMFQTLQRKFQAEGIQTSEELNCDESFVQTDAEGREDRQVQTGVPSNPFAALAASDSLEVVKADLFDKNEVALLPSVADLFEVPSQQFKAGQMVVIQSCVLPQFLRKQGIVDSIDGAMAFVRVGVHRVYVGLDDLETAGEKSQSAQEKPDEQPGRAEGQ